MIQNSRFKTTRFKLRLLWQVDLCFSTDNIFYQAREATYSSNVLHAKPLAKLSSVNLQEVIPLSTFNGPIEQLAKFQGSSEL